MIYINRTSIYLPRPVSSAKPMASVVLLLPFITLSIPGVFLSNLVGDGYYKGIGLSVILPAILQSKEGPFLIISFVPWLIYATLPLSHSYLQ